MRVASFSRGGPGLAFHSRRTSRSEISLSRRRGCSPRQRPWTTPRGGPGSRSRVDRNVNRVEDERGTYAYNAREQLTSWTRSQGPNTGKAVTYVPNASGAVLCRTDEAQPAAQRLTRYVYEGATGEGNCEDYLGDRLLRTVNDGQTTSYRYVRDASDPGEVDLGTVKKIDLPGSAPDIDYFYDEFERLVKTIGPSKDGSDPRQETTYTLDGLDRRDTKTVGQSPTDYSYVGLTEQLAREQQTKSTGEQTTRRTYDYDAALQRLGQASRPDPSSSETYNAYATDPTESVEGLEGADGTVPADASYQYDPYGNVENDTALSADAKDAPFRFQGHYLDAGIETYDMRARAYRPQLGRFLTPDRYESAAADLGLQLDPLTQNRYAFGAANPVNRVEFDGHDNQNPDTKMAAKVMQDQSRGQRQATRQSGSEASDRYQRVNARARRADRQIARARRTGDAADERRAEQAAERVAREDRFLDQTWDKSTYDPGFQDLANTWQRRAGQFTPPVDISDRGEAGWVTALKWADRASTFFGVAGAVKAGGRWGVKQGIKRFVGREGDDATKAGDELLDGISRTYVDITTSKSAIRNVGTNATHAEFAETLTRQGWSPRTVGNGRATLFEKDGARYSLRQNADSYAGWSADYTPAGAKKKTLKIRLGYP